MKERHLILLPDDPEHLIAAVCALQHFVYTIGKKPPERVVAVEPEIVAQYCGPDAYAWLIREIYPGFLSVVSAASELGGFLHEFDIVLDLSQYKQIYSRYAPTRKHAANVFGLLIGADPPIPLPKISNVAPACSAVEDVLFLPGVDDLVVDLITHKYPELSVGRCEVGLPRAGTVVGWRSAETYLAAAFGRGVVELYPEDEYHRDWLSKWSAPGGYQMVAGTRQEIVGEPERVVRGLELLWARSISYRYRDVFAA